MKRILMFLVLGILLASFVIASPLTTRAVENEEKNQGDNSQLQNVIQNQNRLQIQSGECPANCTCDGSATKCQLENGREMTIQAGNSGNIIIQSKNANCSTVVELYKSDGKLYGTFANDEVKEIKMLPDQVQLKIRAKLSSELEDVEIELDENGNYQYTARQRVKLFNFINTRETVRAELGAETGEILRLRKSWWSFLTTNAEPPIVGASCGTVSPDSRNECCQDEGFDFFDEEIGECMFNE